MLIVNGHGGNIAALAAFLPDLQRQSSLKIRTTTYFELAQPAMPAILEDQDGVRHACEAETSMMMALAPELVRARDAQIGAWAAPLHRRPLALGQYRSFRDCHPVGCGAAMPGAPRARRVKS